jgi:hypothetical protein
MNTWNFVISELKSLQQANPPDPQSTVELFVETVLLRGYNIQKGS